MFERAAVGSGRWLVEDQLVREVEIAQARLELAVRESALTDLRRREAAQALERAVGRLCNLILRNMVPDDLD
jgi:hypothetical protein